MKKGNLSQTRKPSGTVLQRKQNPPQRMLVFSSRRLLPEKSSVTINSFLLDGDTEALTVRANLMTVIMKNIPGYGYHGLGD